MSRLSAGVPNRGSGSRAGGWTAVGASREAEVTWNDRRGDIQVSLGHVCLKVPNGSVPRPHGLAFAVRDSVWLAQGSGEQVPSMASVSVFLLCKPCPGRPG